MKTDVSIMCRLCWLASFFTLNLLNLQAFGPPTQPELPNFDRRASGAEQQAAAENPAALSALRAQLPDARVHFDERVGTPKWIVAERGFLSGPGGSGRGIRAQTAAAFGVKEPQRATKAFLKEHQSLFGFGPEILTTARVKRQFVTAHNGLTTTVWEQELDGIAVFEGVLISHETKNEELVNLASHFIPNPAQAADAAYPNRAALVSSPTISAKQAVALTAQNLDESLNEAEVSAVEAAAEGAEQRQHFQAPPLNGDARVKFIWLPMNRSTLRLCWEVELTSRARGEMYRLLVDVQTGEVLVRHCLTEYISDASYQVFTSDSPSPFSPGCSTPCTTQPPVVSRTLMTLSAVDTNASPLGWIDDGANETRGNNVDAHTDRDNTNTPDLPRPQGSPFRVFDFALDLTQAPSVYTNAAVTDLFYWCNWVHDKLYVLGFTEAAGNFQSNNFARGGLGNDALQADAQDGSGSNNANMSTPSDGSAPRMQMFVFTGPTPDRDGDFDHEIVIHEYIHGLSNRRVGGGVGLSALQSRGMGEGWSDWYALTMLSEPGDDVNGVYAKGGYATYLFSGLTTNYYFGIRRYPYCTDMTKNPLTFKDINPTQASTHPGIPRSPVIGTTADEVHNMGEVWCVALWDARANLIAKYGYNTGNQLILQLVTDGMNLSPANPNFIQARNAILQADLVNSGGANQGELWSAFAKRGLGYSATSPASSTTAGLVEAYDVIDDLFINPLSLAASGPVGGPFSPNPLSFVLTNTGSTNLNWSLSSTSAWFTVSPTSGTLSVGGGAAVATVTILPAAGSLPMGSHVVSIWFTNQTSGVVQQGSVTVSAVGSGMADDFDDFDPGLDLSQWSAFGGVVGSTVLANSYGGYVSAPNSLWFGDGGNRFATTIPINTSGGGSIGFAIRLANGSSSTWETADSLPGEGLVMESSTDGGVNWSVLGSYDTTNYYNWTTVTSSIPLVARAAATQFRWRQKSHSGSGYDHWALDNVVIDATPAAILTLDVVSMVAEGGLPLNATVTASPTPTNDLTVNLASLDPSELTVPATVTILAGQSNAVFTLTIVDDAELDGTQTTQINAAAGGHASAATPVTIFDNETATLMVQLPASVTEGGATAQGTVSASAAPSANITVSLLSSDTSEIQVPPSVLLPAGQTSAVFNITVVNDTLIDGAQSATVTVQVPGWTDGVGNIIVQDNEPTNLVVTLPASAREGNGVLLNAGTVRIAGTLPTNLVVNLLSADASELTVPPASTILAGQTTATFDLTIVDDPDVDSSQSVSVNASAFGFAAGSTNMIVTDNESPPEPFSPTPAHFATNVLQTADISWQSGALPGEVITNDVYLGTSFALGPANHLGSTTNTTWDLPLLAPQTAYYWQIVARKTGVTPGPVWRFTTRGVDHFVWDAIPSPQGVSQPFAVTITAKDAFETTVSNFTGTVNLSSSGGAGQTTNTILGNVIHSTSGSGTYTLGYSFTPNTNLTVTHVRSYSGTKITIWNNAGVMLASQNVSGPAGAWTETPLASPLTLDAGVTYRVGLYTGGGSYYWSSSGSSVFPNGTINQGYEISGDAFPTTTDSVRWWFVDLRYTVGGVVAVSISPTNTGNFSNGTWTGPLTVLSPTTNLVLRADDGNGHTGVSGPFAVELRNDISVTVTDTPDPVSLGGNITYSINVTNIGPASASGVVVSNLLSQATTLVSATPSQGTTQTNGNSIICSLGSIPGNASATVIIVAAAAATGTITNQTFVFRSDEDTYPANNSTVATTSVQTPVITINDVSVFEGNSGTANAAFTVRVSPAPAVPTSVDFATGNSTAVSPSDFFSTNGTLNFAPGQATQTVAVVVVGDTLYEYNEIFTVNLSSATNATISDSTGAGTILNDDPTPTLSISDVTLKEGNVGTTNAVFNINLSAASELNTTFSYGTANGNASSSSDYTSRSGSLTIPAGSTSTNIVITVTGDFTIESDEVFYLDLSSAGNAILLKREGVGLILNDDGLPGDVDRFTWSAVASPQYVGQPFGVTINAWDAFNNPAVNFTGPANLSAVRGPVTTNILGANTTTASFPIYTGYYAQRTQVIYPAGELGGAGRITALALDVSSVPGLVLNNWTIRLKHTALTNYTSYVWESTNWTMVYQINLPVNTTGWLLFPLSTPFDYDGTNSLMVDFSFYNSTTYGAGACRTTSRSATRTIHTATSSYGSPLTWSGSSPAPSATSVTPNLQLIRGGERIPAQPLITGSFSNGTWTGNVTALAGTTNAVLRVDDGVGHSGVSGSFAVQLRDDLSITATDSPDPVSLGGGLAYILSVTNIGPSSAIGVVVTNLLAPDVTLVSASSTQGDCTNFGQTVVCNLGTMPADSQAMVTILTTPTMIGVITNRAFVSRTGADSLVANNFATNSTSVLVPALAINSSSVLEGDFGQTAMTYAVQLSPASPSTVTVNFATSNGTAQAGSDYIATNGTLSYLPGQTNQLVTVFVIGDTNGEGNETVTVNLASPTNAAISVASTTGTILNDDVPAAQMPFVENWESGSFEPYWSVTGTGNRRALVTANNGPTHGGTYHLTMDTSSGAARNEVTLTINLAGWTNVLLRFYGREWSDEASGPPTIPFYGGADFDGIAISMDSNAWYEVRGLRDLTSTYQIYQVDLDVAIRTYGLSYTPYFYIRFNQYDDTAITSDGIGVDDIEITGVLRDDLQLSPSGAFVASGYEGGPFDPSNKVYTVFNSGTANLLWSASSAQNWVTVQPAGGSLPPGLTTNVTVSFNANTDALTNGNYLANVIFSNLITGVSQTRAVQLNVLELPQPPPVPFNPSPTNFATGVSVHTLLSWNGSTFTAGESEHALNGAYGVIDTFGYDADALARLQGMPGLTGSSLSWATINGSSGASLLAAYDVIYFAVNSSATDYSSLRTAVANGSPLERYVHLGGTLVLNLAGNAGSQADVGPGGLYYDRTLTHESATIVSSTHPFITGGSYGGTPLTEAMFANWLNTDHGVLTNVPGGAVELLRNPDGTSMIEYSWGAGRVIASTLIFGWTGSTLRFGPPFTNELLYAASADAVTPTHYCVYLGTNLAALRLIASNLTETVYSPGALEFNSFYYWQVVASNMLGSVTGAVWQFTTALDEVHFASGASSISEGGGLATIAVVRENPAGGVLNVQYSTTNGTATAGADYTPISGTLQFAAGVTSTNFQVPILEDGVAEGNETVQLRLSQASPNVLLASPSNTVLTIVDNDAVAVSVFSDPAYVDTGTSTDGEVTNVIAALLAKGCVVRTFTGITATDFSNALIGAPILYVPDLENGDLGAALSAASKSVISNFVAGGGRLIINGQTGSRDENFLNQVFGYNIAGTSSSNPTLLSGAAAGTAFAGGPASLPENNGTYGWSSSSLPAGALNIYQDSSALYTTVALIPKSAGKIIFLAYDWYNAAPRGTQDGGWDDVLRRAVLEATTNTPAPPVITLQPHSQMVVAGSNATFSVTASSGVPLSYLWRRNGNLIAGATASSYSTNNVQWADSGAEFSCLVSNAYGTVISSNALLTVLSPPVVTVQPTNQTVSPASITSFTMVATGTEPMSYQWQKNLVNLTNNGHYLGCTTNQLLLINCDAGDVGNYRCVVTNAYGSTNSIEATLAILPTAYPCLAIANGDFEGGFTLAGGGYIANHWTEWEALPGVAIGYDETSIIHGGTHSQRIRVWGVTDSTSGGVYQRVPVTPGQPYMVSVWAYAGDALSACYLGVDPSGGTDPNGSVTWSSAATSPTWALKTLTGNAATNYITIFYKVAATDGNKRNGFFDDTMPANSAGPFQLALHQMGNNLTLTWPECPHAQLQRAGDLTGSLWTPATNQVTISGGQKSVTLTPTGAAGYFRLVLQ